MFKQLIHLCLLASTYAVWSDPASNQYHIQTDEGPERYFKYQTDNGQYRKEKRLHDGTVIGTDAWIDASGFLRQNDYIADTGGYRILNTKTVFVGQGRRIDEAMTYAKKSPASDNALIPAVRASTPAPLPPPSSTVSPFAHVAVTTYRPAFLYRPEAGFSTTTASPRVSYAQPNVANVFIKHHGTDPLLLNGVGPSAFDDNYLQPSYDVTSRYIPPHELNNALASSSERYVAHSVPSTVFEPPLHTDLEAHGIKPVGVVSSTPAPISITSQNLASVSPISHGVSSTTSRPYYPSSTTVRSSTPSYYPSTTVRPLSAVSSNYVAPPIERPYTAKPASYYSAKDYGSPSYYSESSGGQSLGKGYRPYDGESLTNEDGFRYFLPRHYHEEQGSNDVRDGSFGYIDPFGIRRVVYYNVRPGSGFRHRKNNRYVGFDATPYDPRPSRK